MSLCTHLYLDLVDGTRCTREDHPQDPGGHVYKDGSGRLRVRRRRPARRRGSRMIVTVLLIMILAAGSVPLIQRDLRIAHARIEERRRIASMTPIQRLGYRVTSAFADVAISLAAFGDALGTVGPAYRVELVRRRRRAERARRRR